MICLSSYIVYFSHLIVSHYFSFLPRNRMVCFPSTML